MIEYGAVSTAWETAGDDAPKLSNLEPYRPQRLDHQPGFTTFLNWAGRLTTSPAPNDDLSPVIRASYEVQIVQHINFGPQESIHYFVPVIRSFELL